MKGKEVMHLGMELAELLVITKLVVDVSVAILIEVLTLCVVYLHKVKHLLKRTYAGFFYHLVILCHFVLKTL